MTKALALKVLGLTGTPEWSDVKERYRQLSLTAHPDVGGTTEGFQALCEAYKALHPNILITPDGRTLDLTLIDKVREASRWKRELAHIKVMKRTGKTDGKLQQIQETLAALA